MSSLNSFKLLDQKCLSYFNILEKELGRTIKVSSEVDKRRFGFYIYALESICNIKDPAEITEFITDTDFNKVVFNEIFNDQGVDAIYIDEENNQISIFNFKFRENYKDGKKQNLNDTFVSTKFANAIVNNDASKLENKLKKFAEDILKHLHSRDVWNLKLFVVSNDHIELDTSDSTIQQLEKVYDLEVVPIALAEISNFMSIRPKPVEATLVVDNDAIMSYTENSLSSAKSFIIRLTIPELIRITCSNKSMREAYNLEDYTELASEKLDFAVLFDNVRGFLGETKYNGNIIDTLKKDPSKFFMYNNGITITSEDIISEPINGNRKMKLVIKNLQVVNGGQTLRSIHNFNSSNPDNLDSLLSDCEILVRVFKTGGTPDLINKIAEYTNSQNAISMVDLKSLAQEQIMIEQFLDNKNIIYARKSGDTGLSKDKVYTHKISMEKFAQILFAMNGFPEKASNQKKKIFEKFYDQTFKGENFDINKCSVIVERYYIIKEAYESSQFKSNDQKIFYILYMDQFLEDTEEEINFLEETIQEYKSEDVVSDARKLIQIKFKELLDEKIHAL